MHRPKSRDSKTFVGVIGRGGGAIPPVLALASGLVNRGHRVVIVADDEHRAQVERLGLETILVPQGHSLGEIASRDRSWVQRVEKGDDLEGFVSHYEQFAREAFPHICSAVAALNPDALFSSLFTHSLAKRLAEHLDIPWAYVNPAFVFGPGSPRPIGEDIVPHWLAFAFETWIIPVIAEADLVLHTTDREYDPVTDQLPRNHSQVGPLNPASDGVVPGYLIEDGPPWVLVSTSTFPQADEIDLIRHSLDALNDMDVRVIVTAPKLTEQIANVPKNALVVEFASHDVLLERCDLAISHAGHGLVMRALQHGVPMVLVPWGRDQPGVAYRANKLGVAEIVDREDLTAASISAAVRKIRSNEAVKRKSSSVAIRLSAESPLDIACDLMESLPR